MQTLPHTRFTKSFSMMIIVIAYLVSYGFAAFSIVLLKNLDWHPLWKLLLADTVGTVVIFLFSIGFKNSSFYDAYWSVAPPIFLLFLIPLADVAADQSRIILVCIVVVFWAIRLTLNWIRHWEGIKQEDWRYAKLKGNGGFKGFMSNFFAIHFIPTLMVFGACLPLYPAIVDQQTELNVFDLMAFSVCLAAVAIEIVADEQVHLFKRRIKDPGEFMKTGIWKYSRHPNYFGEWLFWLGLYLMGVLANPSYWWTGFGMLIILSMFLFASIPMMDERMKAKRPDYAEHMKRVSRFFPFPHK